MVRVNSRHLAATAAHPRSRLLLLADLAVQTRDASSLYMWDTSDVLYLENKDEPRARGIDIVDDHATARHC